MCAVSYIALGANLPAARGDPAVTVVAALQALNEKPFRLRARSRLYQTPCHPPGAGPDYVNAAAIVTAAGGPEATLSALHAIEAALGRQRQGRWAARRIDLDLLAVDALVRPDAATLTRWMALPAERQAHETPAELVLPHPRLQDRAFVLGPLVEIAPDWRHPLLGGSIAEMYAALPAADRAAIKPIPDPPAEPLASGRDSR